SNGQALKGVQDCVKKGFNKFLIPIVSCGGNFNQSSTVTGFATIIVDSVVATGTPKGVNLHAIFQDVQGTPGGGAYGTGEMRLLSGEHTWHTRKESSGRQTPPTGHCSKRLPVSSASACGSARHATSPTPPRRGTTA